MRDSELCLGEDVSYYNFVACHSSGWDMDAETGEGIVNECYYKRRYFLRQLVQSMPRTIIVFGKAVMRAFVEHFGDNFEEGKVPDPDEAYREILSKNDFAMDIGEEEGRVIFSHHPTGAGPWYIMLGGREKVVDALYDEFDRGNLIYDGDIGHLQRSRSACEFCNDDAFFMGKCRYREHFEGKDTRPAPKISRNRRARVEELKASES